jgi:ATP-binding cassette subfamily C protein CydCD
LADAGALQVRTRAADARLAALAAATPAVSDPAHPARLPERTGQVQVRSVAAGWGPQPAFENLCLDLDPGDRVAVVGPSGSGKSTLAALLLRFLDPSSGSVMLSDVPATSLRLDDVRRTVGLVDDDPHVFASTVYENVRLARPTATRDEVAGALRTVHLGGWLDGLPRGLDTMLGDGFDHLSGGERARLGMARALLAGSRVLVLDEPTAHLDSATAEAVAADLLDAGHGRSVVWVTHGKVGLDRVDMVLDLGRTAGPDVPAPATVPG